MRFRFRQRLRLLPGVSINLSRHGASVSLGGRGLSINLNKKGVRTTAGLPGMGLSYAEQVKYEDISGSNSGSKKLVLTLVIGAALVLLLWFAR